MLAIIIMAQNEAKNSMFYTDKNMFEKKPGRRQRFANVVSRAERGRIEVKNAISKPLNSFLRLTEGAVRLGLKGANKVVSNTGRFATWVGSAPLATINRMMETKSIDAAGKEKITVKWYMSPLWAVTRLTEAGFDAANRGFNYTNKHGNEIMHTGREKVIGMIQHGFNDKNINNVYELFTNSVDGATEMVGKSTAAIGQMQHDRLEVAQKRNILADFYKAASAEDSLEELMASGDIAEMLNLKER